MIIPKFFSKKWFIVLILFLLIFLALFLFWPHQKTIKGKALSVNLENRKIVLEIKKQTVDIMLNDATKIVNSQNIPIALSEIIKGFMLSAKGNFKEKIFNANFVKVIKAPELIIDEPQPNQKISEHLIIAGRAKMSVKELYFALKDKNNNLLTDDKIPKETTEIVPYIDFKKEIDLDKNWPVNFWLEIYQKEPNSNVVTDKIIIPLTK